MSTRFIHLVCPSGVLLALFSRWRTCFHYQEANKHNRRPIQYEILENPGSRCLNPLSTKQNSAIKTQQSSAARDSTGTIVTDFVCGARLLLSSNATHALHDCIRYNCNGFCMRHFSRAMQRTRCICCPADPAPGAPTHGPSSVHILSRTGPHLFVTKCGEGLDDAVRWMYPTPLSRTDEGPRPLVTNRSGAAATLYSDNRESLSESSL